MNILKWTNSPTDVPESTRFTCRVCDHHIDAPEDLPQTIVNAEILRHLDSHPEPEPYGDPGTPSTEEERLRLAHDLEQEHWDSCFENCDLMHRVIEVLREDQP